MSVSYLTPKARPVHVGAAGRGSVAVEPIAAGEVVVAFGGRAMTRDEFDLLPLGQQSRSIQIEEHLYLAGAPEPEPADFINHSCAPNCGMRGSKGLAASDACAECNIPARLTDAMPMPQRRTKSRRVRKASSMEGL